MTLSNGPENRESVIPLCMIWPGEILQKPLGERVLRSQPFFDKLNINSDRQTS